MGRGDVGPPRVDSPANQPARQRSQVRAARRSRTDHGLRLLARPRPVGLLGRRQLQQLTEVDSGAERRELAPRQVGSRRCRGGPRSTARPAAAREGRRERPAGPTARAGGRPARPIRPSGPPRQARKRRRETPASGPLRFLEVLVSLVRPMRSSYCYCRVRRRSR